jgi:hypothetical protein
MIVPDAKCVVNGKKLNALISAVNPLLATIKETLDVVDGGNQPGKRQFLIMKVDGAPDPSARQQLTADGSDGGDVDGGAGNQRDKLDAANGGAGNAGIKVGGGGANGGGDAGINVTGGGGALRDDGSRPANQTNQPVGALRDDGSRPANQTNQPVGALRDDGSRPANQTNQPDGALRDDGSRPANQTNQPDGALRDDGSRPANQTTEGGEAIMPPLPGGEPPNQKQEAKEKARRQREYKGDPMEFEMGRRKREASRAKRRQKSTETFMQNLATKKRQAEADRLARHNKMGGKYSPYARGRG